MTLVGYNTANSQSPGGLRFVNFSRPVVIVVRIQYWPGALGFLSDDAVGEDSAGNAGFQDECLASQWV
jgi:carboxylesterase type B